MSATSGSVKWRRMVNLAGLVLLLLSVFSTLTEARYSELFSRNSRSPAGLGPPVRPKVFQTADELTTYLAELADYYAVLGRPRFGKRGSLSSTSNTRLPALLRGLREFRKRDEAANDEMDFVFGENRESANDDTGKMNGNMLDRW